ncbi:MAG: AAA family ATPase [Verrucomicrobia bacterium]|nr:AAA family ATPase [Verrucomicrobiota bacterium]
MSPHEQAERRLVGCIFGQLSDEGARRAHGTGLAENHFTDPFCACLYRAVRDRATAGAPDPPLLDPAVLPAAGKMLGRAIDDLEIQSLVDDAPPSVEFIPGLARHIMEGHARRKAAQAMEVAFHQLGNGHETADILARVRAAVDLLESEGAPAAAGPVPVPLADLRRAKPGFDPDELLRNRFLCRGGAALLIGPTGVGKSSLSMQAALLWAIGFPAFGLEPARPLRILIVQAENDDGDLAEMRDGVIAGLNLRDEDRDKACAGIRIVTEDTRTREGFAAFLDRTLRDHPVDLVIVDPAFAYLGGDASSQRDVSPFLRNMLNPVVHKHRVGLILVHHVNKPASGEQRPQWQAGDYAYLGAGSAEFANWARAVIAIRSIGSDEVFELLLAKRGRRVGWKDDLGRPTNSRYIAYHREPGVICWREVSTAEVEALTGGGKPTIQDVVDVLAGGPEWKQAITEALEKRTGLSSGSVHNLIKKAEKAKAIEIVGTGPHGAQMYRSTGELKPRTAGSDTKEEVNEDNERSSF